MGAVTIRVRAQRPACEPPHRVVGEGLCVLSRSQGPGTDPGTSAGRRADCARPGQAVLLVVTEGLVVCAGGHRGACPGDVARRAESAALGGPGRPVARARYLDLRRAAA